MIGAVLRFPENRRFPTDFELEVDDLMRSILEGRAMDAAEKRIDNLLGGSLSFEGSSQPEQLAATSIPLAARSFRIRIARGTRGPARGGVPQSQRCRCLVSWSVDTNGHVFPSHGGAAEDDIRPHVIVDDDGVEWAVREVTTPQAWARGSAASCSTPAMRAPDLALPDELA